ncbi:MAG: FAD-dependent oxidoreductase [Planctomycetes bacterium]|nr:FAD-dependent oxidoreductase [Planctomycetota bacterium]
MTPRVAIIGGGIAGLTAAHRLLARNVEVVVIDKGRRAGGRLCTRAVELPDGRTARFDLGPPVLYARYREDARGQPYHSLTNFAAEVGASGFGPVPVARIGAAGEHTGNAPLYGLAAPGGMRDVAFRVVANHRETLEFHDHAVADKLERTDDGWRVHVRSARDGSEWVVRANGLILTPPAPQTLALVERSAVEMPDDIRDALRGVQYDRCFALYGVFSGADQLQPGGVWFGDGPLEWITDGHRRGLSPVPWSVTAHTTHEWAVEHWVEPDARVIELLLPRLRVWAGVPVDPAAVFLHRWQWARPREPIRAPCAVLRDAVCVLAGDAFAGSVPDPADAAVVSGDAAARRMGGLLTALVRNDDRYTVAAPRRCALEIAVSSPLEAKLAERAGADRLELSVGLDVGGLTPSIGLFREVRRLTDLPIYVLLRPRPGGFTYTRRELHVMTADAEALLREGAAGIVFGALTERAGIDTAACRPLVELAEVVDKKAVFHRAFDFVANPLEALDELIDLGFERVLTSGGATTAEAGTSRLQALVQHAGWQLEVMPGGGVRAHNVRDLVRATRCHQVHAAARVPVADPVLGAHPRLALAMGPCTELSADHVRALRHALDRAADDVE